MDFTRFEVFIIIIIIITTEGLSHSFRCHAGKNHA